MIGHDPDVTGTSPKRRDPLDRYYTEDRTARVATAWLASELADLEIRRVCCPAVGAGAFLFAALDAWPSSRVVGLDVDRDAVARVAEVARARRYPGASSWGVRICDATDPEAIGAAYPDAFDLVLDNPPNNRIPDYLATWTRRARVVALLMRLAVVEVRQVRENPPAVVALVPRPAFGGPARAGLARSTSREPWALFVWRNDRTITGRAPVRIAYAREVG